MLDLKASKSRFELGLAVVDIVNYIFNASEQQFLTPCVIQALRETIRAYKRAQILIGPVIEFYDYQERGKMLPTWIILHSTLADDQSTTSARHFLLQTYLDEIPPTPAIRDELYLACAKKGYNNYFDRIRQASLGSLQTRPELIHAIDMDLRLSFKLPDCPSETFTVVNTTRGFKLSWFVPDMLPKLQLGAAIGMEFVAKGLIWGLYIQTQCLSPGPFGWDVALCVLKPSQNNLNGYIVASLEISRHETRKIFSRRSTRFELYSCHVETSDFPEKRRMPKTQARWHLSSSTVEKCYRCINKDGSCYLTFDLVIKSRKPSH